MNTRGQGKDSLRRAVIVFVIVGSLGFPGNYTKIFGEIFGTAVEYLSFGLQLAAMVFLGREYNGVLELTLIDLKGKYGGIYFMALVFFFDSMLVSHSPQEQLITCLRFTVTVFFALWIVDHYGGEEILEMVSTAQGIFVGLTILLFIFRPDLVFASEVSERDFVGLFATKNNAAAELSCGILLQMGLYQIKKQKGKAVSRGFLILLLIQGVLLVLCNALGPIVCAVVPGIYLFLAGGSMEGSRRLPLGIFYIAGSVGFLVLALTVLPVFEPVFRAFGKDASLTGRVPLWRQIIRVMTENHTFTGFGYGMFWRDRSAVALIHTAFSSNSFMGSMTTGAHNMILELWMNVGLFGVGAFFLAILSSTSRIRQIEAERYIPGAAYLLWFMLFGLTERAISPYQYHTLFLIISLGILSEAEGTKGRRTVIHG